MQDSVVIVESVSRVVSTGCLFWKLVQY